MNSAPPDDVDVAKGSGAVNGEEGEGVCPNPVLPVGCGRVVLAAAEAGDEG